MAIHVEPVTQTARWYERDGGFERWEAFAAVATLEHVAHQVEVGLHLGISWATTTACGRCARDWPAA